VQKYLSTGISEYPLVIAFLLVLVLAVLSNLCVQQANSQAKFESYTVKLGDSLWKIAEERCSNNVDLREYIYEVKKINSLDSANIKAGEVLELPEE